MLSQPPHDGVTENKLQEKDYLDIFTWCTVKYPNHNFIIKREYYKKDISLLEADAIFREKGGIRINVPELAAGNVWNDYDGFNIYPPTEDEFWKHFEKEVENPPKLPVDLTKGKWRNIDYRAVRGEFPWLGEKIHTKKELYLAVVFMKYGRFNPVQTNIMNRLKPMELKRLSFELSKCTYFRTMPTVDRHNTYEFLTSLPVRRVHSLIMLSTSADRQEVPFSSGSVEEVRQALKSIADDIEFDREGEADLPTTPERLDTLLLEYMIERGCRTATVAKSEFTGMVTATFELYDLAYDKDVPEFLKRAPSYKEPPSKDVVPIDQLVVERFSLLNESCKLFNYRGLCAYRIQITGTMTKVLRPILQNHFPEISHEAMERVLETSTTTQKGLYHWLTGIFNLEDSKGVVSETRIGSKMTLTCCANLCGLCHLPGHTRRTCSKSTCNRCKKKGHWQRDCPERKTNKQARAEAQAQPAVMPRVVNSPRNNLRKSPKTVRPTSTGLLTASQSTIDAFSSQNPSPLRRRAITASVGDIEQVSDTQSDLSIIPAISNFFASVDSLPPTQRILSPTQVDAVQVSNTPERSKRKSQVTSDDETRSPRKQRQKAKKKPVKKAPQKKASKATKTGSKTGSPERVTRRSRRNQPIESESEIEDSESDVSHVSETPHGSDLSELSESSESEEEQDAPGGRRLRTRNRK